MDSVECELCGQQAFLYCPSDSAFLCCHCDREVHTANFLVARHVRHRLGAGSVEDSCSSSSAFSSSATGKMKKIDSYSSSLTQLSRDELPSNKRKRGEEGLTPGGVEGIFVNWSRGFGLRLCGDGKRVTWREQLRRVEEMSGAAGDEILAVESRLAPALGPQDLKEGWAEC